MTGPSTGSSSGGERKKGADLGGADAVPDTPATAKRQGAEPNAEDRRLTPRGAATAAPSGSGIKPIVWVVVAIVVIAIAYFALGT
jgi:hypothetical protein